MSIRLDPRRVNGLKHLAGEAGVRPGDLVRQWVEERIDAARLGTVGVSLESRLQALEQRLAALESSGAATPPAEEEAPGTAASAAASASEPEEPSDGEPSPRNQPGAQAEAPKPRERKRVAAAPSGERVPLHEEMIAVIRERGPMTAGELAQAVTERGRYAPPRSGKSIDAAMISQRVSNPTYRSRFTRTDGMIGLADAAE